MNVTTQVRKPQIKWTDDKINRLREEYPLCQDKKKLAMDFGISYGALKDCARRFKIKSKTDVNHYKLKALYNDSCIAYYWLGVIMADGYIDKEGELKVTLSIKDKNHLEKLASLLGIKLHTYESKTKLSNNEIYEYCKITCKDSVYGKKLIEKFDLKDNKTYNPPSILIDDDFLFLSLLIGFIDGDGTFSKNENRNCSFIRIEIHKNWKDFLIKIQNKLLLMGIDGIKIKENKRGYIYFSIYRNKNFLFLKEFILKHKLPVLERKWNCIKSQ